jgi:hypothetical protein
MRVTSIEDLVDDQGPSRRSEVDRDSFAHRCLCERVFKHRANLLVRADPSLHLAANPLWRRAIRRAIDAHRLHDDATSDDYYDCLPIRPACGDEGLPGVTYIKDRVLAGPADVPVDQEDVDEVADQRVEREDAVRQLDSARAPDALNSRAQLPSC